METPSTRRTHGEKSEKKGEKSDEQSDSNVKVVVRCRYDGSLSANNGRYCSIIIKHLALSSLTRNRPLSEKERLNEHKDLLRMEKHRKEISVVTEKGGKVRNETPY